MSDKPLSEFLGPDGPDDIVEAAKELYRREMPNVEKWVNENNAALAKITGREGYDDVIVLGFFNPKEKRFYETETVGTLPVIVMDLRVAHTITLQLEDRYNPFIPAHEYARKILEMITEYMEAK